MKGKGIVILMVLVVVSIITACVISVQKQTKAVEVQKELALQHSDYLLGVFVEFIEGAGVLVDTASEEFKAGRRVGSDLVEECKADGVEPDDMMEAIARYKLEEILAARDK